MKIAHVTSGVVRLLFVIVTAQPPLPAARPMVPRLFPVVTQKLTAPAVGGVVHAVVALYLTESAKYASSAVIRFRRSDFIDAMYAFSFVLANFGIAIAASSPMMTTTINSSSSVNPVRFMRSLRLNRVRPKLRGRDNAATERRVVMLVSQRSCRGGHDRRQLATHHGHTPRARGNRLHGDRPAHSGVLQGCAQIPMSAMIDSPRDRAARRPRKSEAGPAGIARSA